MASPTSNSGSGMRSVASLARLEEFFGAKPRLEYARLPYKLNLITAECDLKTHNIWLQFMPVESWAELRLAGKPFSIAKLDLSDVSHMSVRRRDSNLQLVFRFARAFTSDLVLCLRPHVMLFWGNQGPGSITPSQSKARYSSDA
jgi:hypothetical protein